jgi:hypothetical protein
MFVACELIFPYLIVLILAGSIQQAEAESFLDIWLSKQGSQSSDDWLSQSVASQLQKQLPPSSSFNRDEWLARQKSTTEEEWPAHQATEQPASSDSTDASVDGMESQETWTPASSWEADEDLEHTLLSDLEGALGTEHRRTLEGRISGIEERMGRMFQALPKNEYGKLGHSTVRYMLHRSFVEQHGWYIDGLFTEGAAINSSSPAHALKGRVPMFVEGLFEKRLGGRGFRIHDMAFLAAVIEDSIQGEALAELQKTYTALQLPINTVFTKDKTEELDWLVDNYMSGFVMRTNMSEATSGFMSQQLSLMSYYYPAWADAQQYFRQVRRAHTSGAETYSFREVAAIVRELVDKFGTFHGKQCQGLKRILADMESGGTAGCISLPNFYSEGLKTNTTWLLMESPDYLRSLGVLDENDPKSPSVLTANYINGPNSCIAPTGYYMVCCRNECDDIMGKLEKELGQPSATATEIIAALRMTSGFSSSASLRSGSLAPSLRRRLQEVAAYHDGRVPIHGRLFAQWLHHIYPHECSYPHMSGSKHPQWVDDFEAESGRSILSEAEMRSWVLSKGNETQSNKTLSADFGSCAPWQKEEELLAPMPRALPHELANDPHIWYVTRALSGVAFLAAVSTLMISLSRMCLRLRKLAHKPKILLV